MENGELSIEQILSADDRNVVRIETPEWGGHVYVTRLSGDDRDRIDERYQKIRAGDGTLVGLRAEIVAKSLCDSSGNPSKDANGQPINPTQIVLLGRKSAAVLDRIADKCQELSGVTDKAVEELEKNSETVTNDDSG